jgi:hypothetical protein
MAKAGNHRVVALKDAAEWFADVRGRNGVSARALEFLALTAVRSGRSPRATWAEVDLEVQPLDGSGGADEGRCRPSGASHGRGRGAPQGLSRSSIRTILRPVPARSPGSENITQSFFLSPKKPTAGGLVWGVGPVLQLPVANDDIAPDQWGAGITGVALKQVGPWTAGGLANHVWSISGDDEY